MSKYTELELKVFENIRTYLRDNETDFIDHFVLIDCDDNPKQMRGAIASLIKKRAIDVDYDYGSNINGTMHYPVTVWDEETLGLDYDIGYAEI